MLIALFGPDGSGKTSICRTLAKNHKTIGIRGTHTIASLIARFLNKSVIFQGSDNPYFRIRIPRKMQWLWQNIEFASIIPLIFYRFALLPKFKAIVAERSIPDFIAWVVVTTENPRFIENVMGRFLLTLCRKQNRLIYVTASIEELCRRRPESVRFIREQVRVYDNLAKILKASRLDTTSKTVQESVKEITSVLLVEGICQIH